jgi:lipopolysaccharide biosynthesis glycosyltransferase
MEIIYASDENYFPYIYVGIQTLLETNKDNDIHINYIYQNVCDKSLKFLDELGMRFGHKINSFEFVMPEVYEKLPSYQGSGSKTTYAKFLFASMFPDADKVLFLDPDTIVLRSIQYLIDLDLKDYLIAGVTECLPSYHKDAAKMDARDQYINGGMVLCNLKKWREEKFEEQALERLADTTTNFNYDQGIINEMCVGRILVLEPKYNALAEVFAFKSASKIKRRYNFEVYYTQKQIEETYSNPVIIHFTEFLYNKPLSKYCTHPYAEYFWEKLNSSPLNYKLSKKQLDKKHKIRKWMLDRTPFSVYMAFENFLDFRRIFYMKHPKIKALYTKRKKKGKIRS